MKTKLLLLLSLCVFQNIWAQQLIGGTVSDANNTPLPGASVIIKGTTTGTQSDFDGGFTIQANTNDILVISYLGHITQEIPVATTSNWSIVLQEDLNALDEVVVVGYGTQRKSDLTGAVSSISSNDITKNPLMGVADAISGKAPGIQVITNTGRPGAAPVIRVRGVGTLNDASPIFVVDGLILSDISFLNNNDIESLEVLKDASATAIYGSRGANGVVLVTTKKGKLGKSSIDFRVSTGISKVENVIDMANASEYGILQNRAAVNAGETVIPFPDPESLGGGVDWWDELYSTAISKDYSLSFSGATDKLNYFISAGLQDQEGIIKKTDYKRLTIRANNEYTLTSQIKVGHNISFINTDKLNGPDATQGAYRTPSAFEPFNEDGFFNGSTEFFNPLVGTFYNNAESNLEKFVGNFYGEIAIKDFKFRSTYGFEKNDGFSRAYAPEYVVSDRQFRDLSTLNKTYTKLRSYIWDNILTYTKEQDEHRVDLLAGITKQDTFNERLRGSASDFPNNEDLWYLDATFDPESRVSENSASSWSYLSYLFRANYSLKDKYLFTGTYRIDGSSKFDEDYRYGHFPSLAVGWRVSEESFMDNAKSISNLKLRASWGQIGNDKVGAYASKQFLSTTESIGGRESGIVGIFGPDEKPNQGATATRLADPTIQWETTTQVDIGIEMGLFDNKLKAEIDYYDRTTDDILINVDIPSYFGIRLSPTINAASVNNNGMEYTLGWSDKKGDFSYSISGNLSTVNNEVRELADGRSFLIGSEQSQTLTRTEVGSSIGAFWGFKTDGLFQNQAEIDASPIFGSEGPGDLRFIDLSGPDGVPDGIITREDDMTYIGSPIPDFIYGLNFSCSYKNFDFSMDVNGVQGNEIINLKSQKRWSSSYDYEKRFLNSWNGEGSTNSFPRVNNIDNHNESPNEFWLEDGSYLRIRNVQLGYSLPEKLTAKLKLSNVRTYANISNLKTFTKYSGFTPDIASGNNVLTTGIDQGVYPLSTTFNFGLNVSF